MVVSWWKLWFEQQPWQRKRKGRLLYNCPGPKLAQAEIQTLETALLLFLSGSLDTSPTLPSHTHPCPRTLLQYVHDNSCLDGPVLKFNLEWRTCACRQLQTQGALGQVSHCGNLGETTSVLILPNLLCWVEVHHFQFNTFLWYSIMSLHNVKCNDN